MGSAARVVVTLGMDSTVGGHAARLQLTVTTALGEPVHVSSHQISLTGGEQRETVQDLLATRRPLAAMGSGRSSGLQH